ncbi:MAG: hypothetical protein ACXWXX_00230 [Candidatus Binatia bacterium]
MKNESSDKRKARAFLRSRGFTSEDIPPGKFAATAKKLGKTFLDLLRQIARYKMGGQGMGASPVADDFVSKKQKEADL